MNQQTEKKRVPAPSLATDSRNESDSGDVLSPEPLAIIGIGCRFPGGVTDPASFWELLQNGVDAITEVPAERWNNEVFYRANADTTPGKIKTRWGGFVQNIQHFDPGFFGISPREAARMDPQQRLLLEVAWEALEDGGQVQEALAGTSVGVFIGIASYDYAEINHGAIDRHFINAHTNTGVALSIAANRISYTFNFRGPSIAVDTACSSSLVAVHLACQSLLSGESTLALVGGVNALLKPEPTIGFSQASMLSPDGRCKAFDARANGYTRGEGAGMVLLKRLSAALQDGDPIYALIRSTAVNQDGRTQGMTVPGRLAQMAMLRQAYQSAGVEPGQIQFVEAHGTGTPVGDPIEAEALGAVLSTGRSPDNACLIGSVKTNIGHLEAAAGIAGLIKATLSLQHKMIPPNLHFQEPNPNIPFDKLQLAVPQKAQPWPANGAPARAGVNSFGFGGTNAHVLLQEATGTSSDGASPKADLPKAEMILPLSAKGEAALRGRCQDMRHVLDRMIQGKSSLSITDLCYTASARRSHHNYRLALIGTESTDFVAGLDAYQAGETHPNLLANLPYRRQPEKLVFVFSGMGPQWWGMGRELLAQEPLFREAIETCDALLSQYADWSLLAELTADESQSRMSETQIAQPANFALQIGLARLWQSWGIEPEAIVGHSTGEVAAACVAGALDLETAVRIIYHRSRLQQQVAGTGTMLAVNLSAAEAENWLAGYTNQVSIAAINSPTSVTLSGDEAILQQIAQTLEEQQVFCRLLRVEVPYHSPQMDNIRAELTAALQDIETHPPHIPLYSTVTGTLNQDAWLDADYWWHNVRDPVCFAATIDELIQVGHHTFLELSPHPVLASAITECGLTQGEKVMVLPSLRRQEAERRRMLSSLAALYALGYTPRWEALYPEKGRVVRLPAYPWQREFYWQESAVSHQMRAGRYTHPLLGHRLGSAQPVWEQALDMQSVSYLVDHQVQGVVVYPGAAYVETMLAVAREMKVAEAVTLTEVQFNQALSLSPADTHLVQVGYDARSGTVEIFSRLAAEDDEAVWTHHAAGRLAPNRNQRRCVDLKQLRQRCAKAIMDNWYTHFERMGLAYGRTFQAVIQLFQGEQEAIGRIELAPDLTETRSAYTIHPVLLDACFQTFIGTILNDASPASVTYLPVEIGRLNLYEFAHTSFWSHARLVFRNEKFLEGEIDLLDDDGHVLAEIRGFRCQALAEAPISQKQWMDDVLYAFQWEKANVETAAPPAAALPLPAPEQIGDRLRKRAAQLGVQFRFDRYYQEVEPQLNRLCTAYILTAWRQLGWAMQPGQRHTTATLMHRLAIAPQHQRLFDRTLTIMSQAGCLQQRGDEWEMVHLPHLEPPAALLEKLRHQFPEYSPELDLLAQCGPHLATVWQKKQDPLQLIFPDGSLALTEPVYQRSRSYQLYNLLMEQVVRAVIKTYTTERKLRILEIGAGTGGTTSYLLPVLPPDRTEYVYTDISPSLLSKAQTRFQQYGFIQYHQLDIETDPQDQGLAPHSFDLILASDVLHATCDLGQTLAHVRKLLVSEGLLVLMELTHPPYWFDLVFGMLPGWWAFTDESVRPAHACLSRRAWKDLLEACDFTRVTAVSDEQGERPLHSVILAQGPAIGAAHLPSSGLGTPGKWLIFADEQGIGTRLADRLLAQNQEPIIVRHGSSFQQIDDRRFQVDPDQPGDWQRLWNVLALEEATVQGIVHLWSLDSSLAAALTLDTLAQAQSFSCVSVLHLVQLLARANWTKRPRLWLVTQNGQPVAPGDPIEVAQASLWGLGRVLINEQPEIQCTLVDIDAAVALSETDRLFEALWHSPKEGEVALRGEHRYVHRLQKLSVNGAALKAPPPVPVSEGQPFRLETHQPGALDNLILRQERRNAPSPHEVEIEVYAAGLNFRDVMKAMGIYPTEAGETIWLGDECAGKVVAVGEGVSRFAVGDEVVAIASGAFGTYVTVPDHFVVPKPLSLSFEEAATIPITFLTAYYALYHLGRLQPGERVLIHSASGGVGLAAVQLAQGVSAEIFATAGNPEKRAYLRSLGIPHVMDSRSLDFAEAIMDQTQGEGVDLVLNSLSGEAIPKSLALLRPYGRFLEIGKTDIYQNSKLELWPFRQNLAFFAIDLSRMFQERTAVAKELLQEVFQAFENGRLRPLPHRTFPISQSVEAFRYMAQAKHMGKIVLSLRDPAARVVPSARQVFPFQADGTYLLSGGLGGFGLAVAQWMVREGARHLVLMGRSGASSATARQAVAEMQQAGAEILVLQADVVEEAQVAQVIDTITQKMPPLRGIIHAAMVLDDDYLLQLDKERFDKVMAPKVKGAWNLHTQSLPHTLDFFICFSSFATLIGNPGQGNYAAANAFLDALAHYRRSLGLPGLSINWGSIAEVGYVAQHQEIMAHFERQGLTAFAPEDAMQILTQLLQREAVQAGAIAMNWQQWAKTMPEIATSPRYAHLFTAAAQPQGSQNGHSAETSTLHDLLAVEDGSRRELLETQLSQMLARVLGSTATQIDVQRSLSSHGLDSLMAVELRYLLEKELGTETSTMTLMQASVADLTSQILDQVTAQEPPL